MENLVKGSASELPEQQPPPKRVGLSKKGTISLNPITRGKPAGRKQRSHNYFFYQRGKTRIECEGSPEQAIKVALVDTISRWVVRFILAGISIFITHTAAKKIYGNQNSAAMKPRLIEVRK